MKKMLLAALVAALPVLALQPAAAQTAPMKITMAGGSVGGAWSAIGSAIGETIRRAYPGASFTYEPGRETANILLVSEGKVQLGIAHAQLAKRAAAGGAPFKAPVTNVRAIAQIDPQATVQILVRKDSGITSFAQIKKDKKPVRVVFNQRGTLMAVAGEEVFKANGISIKDIESWGGKVFYVAYNEGLDMMKNGQADVIVNMLAFPAGQVVSATREMQVSMLGLSKEAIARMDADVGTHAIEIPAKTYAFQPDAIETVTGNVVVLASASMPDAEAEGIVNAMLKNFDYLKSAHATLSRLDPSALAQVGPLQMHPGAAAAYKKAGLLK